MSAPLAQSCPNNTVFDSNTNSGKSYKTNLYSLFLALISNAFQANGFCNLTVGTSTPSNDTAVYGLFLCRGDVQPCACGECVTTASIEILRLCPDLKVATIWYDNCMLRYSNISIFYSSLQDSGEWLLYNVVNATNTEKLLVDDAMYQIATTAAYSDKKFAEADYISTLGGRIYALAQCTPDLSSSDCVTCLGSGMSTLPTYSRGARFLNPSCNARYELYPFFNALTPSPEPTPPQPPETTPDHPLILSSGSSKGKSIAIALSIVSSVVLFIITFVFLKRRSIKKHPTKMPGAVDTDDITIDPDSLQYSLRVIELATNKFSVDNKIGQGGFGSVYKGELPNGQDIAVKRLSKRSSQGVAEFKNEIGVVAKLQHNNLVRLLGFCLEGEEKILVYEFAPNRSLDNFLFDSDKKGLLNWSRRRNIIAGVARGLLYLHEDSRLKIVHRDLKAGNILLDEDMQPKIADFGMAKIWRMDQSEGSTTKIAGTFGYMAPEYTRSGQYSIKSDVFSFGVVLLEIITGKKNSAFYKSEDSEDLLSYVWRHWRDDTPLAVLDQTIGDSYVQNEVIQGLHVGLICVEEDANKRPTMASVVYMLNSTSVILPAPRRPATRWHHISKNIEKDSGSDHANNKAPASVNIASITEPYPR